MYFSLLASLSQNPPSRSHPPPPLLLPLVQMAEEKGQLFGDERSEFVCLGQEKKSSLKRICRQLWIRCWEGVPLFSDEVAPCVSSIPYLPVLPAVTWCVCVPLWSIKSGYLRVCAVLPFFFFFTFSESPVIVASAMASLVHSKFYYKFWELPVLRFLMLFFGVFFGFFFFAHLCCQLIPQEIAASGFHTHLPALVCCTDLTLQILHTLPEVQRHNRDVQKWI